MSLPFNQGKPQIKRKNKDFDITMGSTIEANINVINFLDVILKLCNNTCRPYMKENNEINYLHKDSNHSRHIKNQLSKWWGKGSVNCQGINISLMIKSNL